MVLLKRRSWKLGVGSWKSRSDEKLELVMSNVSFLR